MFNKLFIVTTALLFTSVLSAAETYSCNVYIEKGRIKNVLSREFVENKLVFNTEENESNTLLIVRGNLLYDFMFTVTTSHNIKIEDSDNQLSCTKEKEFLNSSGVIMKTECKSNLKEDLNEIIFTADCQSINSMSK